MLSKSQIKLITSLEQKKSRSKTGLFIVEGKKSIKEILGSHFELHSLYTTEPGFIAPDSKTFLITAAELKKISRLTTPQTAVSVFRIPENKKPEIKGLVVGLDGVRDPGNLGTIIRLCDWFGVKTLLCSPDTVDCFNPKVVQATMGSITRVKLYYGDLREVLNNANLPVMGAYLDGENIYTTQLPKEGILIMGNEANGISEETGGLISKKLNIPQFGSSKETESLNVATATAVLLGELKRQGNY